MVVHIPSALLGDTILVEPSMTAWSLAHGNEPVKLYLGEVCKSYACLFNDNPHINQLLVCDYPRNDEYVVPDASAAFWAANRAGLPFAAGYFEQFGLPPDPAKDRLHYKCFGLPPHDPNTKHKPICICPNARSCMNSINPNDPPNIKASTEWWRPIVEYIHSIGRDVFSFGAGEKSDVEPPGAYPYCGSTFRIVAEQLNQAALVISVETGLLHLSGGIDGLPIIFLSSATPPFFSSPPNARVCRAKTPGCTDFDQDEVIGHIKDILRMGE